MRLLNHLLGLVWKQWLERTWKSLLWQPAHFEATQSQFLALRLQARWSPGQMLAQELLTSSKRDVASTDAVSQGGPLSSPLNVSSTEQRVGRLALCLRVRIVRAAGTEAPKRLRSWWAVTRLSPKLLSSSSLRRRLGPGSSALTSPPLVAVTRAQYAHSCIPSRTQVKEARATWVELERSSHGESIPLALVPVGERCWRRSSLMGIFSYDKAKDNVEKEREANKSAGGSWLSLLAALAHLAAAERSSTASPTWGRN